MVLRNCIRSIDTKGQVNLESKSKIKIKITICLRISLYTKGVWCATNATHTDIHILSANLSANSAAAR